MAPVSLANFLEIVGKEITVLGLAAAPTIVSPGSSRISIGPWAVRPISGMVLSSMVSRRMRPVLLATARSSSLRQSTARSRVTPSLSFKTEVARPDRSRR